MSKSQQTISPERKAKIAFETIRDIVTINEAATKYKVPRIKIPAGRNRRWMTWLHSLGTDVQK